MTGHRRFISTTTTDGASTGIVRDPAGTLIGMTANGGAHYYTTSNQGAPSTLTVDQPLGYTGAYLYATGDPINRVDPTGLFSVVDALGTPSTDLRFRLIKRKDKRRRGES
ncbi:hypothetical protein [Streptomyces sp. NPDC126522]|uniref:hypothetical protein n=1 Tax=Streptomyces sp. NPDC126522 TaxID=3155211 RepID=UPI00331E6F9A